MDIWVVGILNELFIGGIFKVEILKTFIKISRGFHMKIWPFFKRKAISKTPQYGFSKKLMFFLLVLKWNLYEQASCVKEKANSDFPINFIERSNNLFAIWWITLKAQPLRSETIFGNWKPFKNHFVLKNQFVLKVFKFLSWLFGHVAKQLDKKDKVNLKFYDVTAWLRNNCNCNIGQYLEK